MNCLPRNLTLWLTIGCLLGLAGCASDDDANSDAGADAGVTEVKVESDPTWHGHIAPIVHQKCSGCHTEGGIAPFSMDSYDEVKDFASLMVLAVEDGRMPPFLARDTDECKPRHAWQNDIRLTASEQQLLKNWADNGAKEGDASKAAKLVPPPSQKLEREDVVIKLPGKITVDGKQDIHTCVVVDPELKEDVYVIGRQITSGNNAVLHHVVSYLLVPSTKDDGTMETKAELLAKLKAEKDIEPGGRYDCFGGPSLDTITTQMLDAWAPGGIPNMAPPDSGQPVSKNSLVLMDVHYHPTGKGAEVDEGTHLGLMLATEKPKMISRVILIGNFEETRDTQFGLGELLMQKGETKAEFMIPANTADHVEEMTWQWKLGATELRIYGMGTHMHYVGRDMRVGLTHTTPMKGEPDEECLIQTPVWDFNWQRGYGYDADYEDLPAMNDGDVLNIKCVFDNTLDNVHVLEALDDQGLDAPVDVPLGEDTLNEMCLAAVGIIYPNIN
jgi:hypothetical protein